MRFQLLGPLDVERSGSRVVLGGPKQRLVLAHLLIRANQVVSTERLIDEIWGEDPPDAARPSLQSYASHLRKALGPDRLEGRAPGYVLHVADDEVDARRFESLAMAARRKLHDDPAAAAGAFRDALAIWRGDPLADLAGELSLQAEIERLSELRLAAIEDRIEAELALGQHGDLASELEGLTAEHPLRERLYGQLMLALYRAGRQAESLNAYHRLRGALSADLGLDPSSAIEALQRRILTQDASLDLRGSPLRGYRTVAVIGSGPVAVVHRAIEPQSQREVAIKVLRSTTANDQQFIRRFESEARMIVRLEHPHVVPLHDWWREPDAAYLVMRLMHGDLASRLAEGGVGSAVGLRWVEQIGSALVAAHRQGVIHGDLRAGNVLMDEDDNAYVSDWSIGYDPAMVEAPAALTSDRRHLAPERKSGGPPSTAADIYALGVMIGDVLARVTGGIASAELRSALEVATHPAPDRRQASAADLVAAARRAVLEPTGQAVGANGMASASRNPYRGLTAFEEADAADFCGREELVRQLVRRIGEPGIGVGLLAVVGPSGSGKSSVVHAGLIPALRTGALPGSDQWLIATMTPADRPFDSLERALLGVAVDTPTALGEVLTSSSSGLGTAVRRVLPPGAHLLLVLDQFEELFTLVSDTGERDRFLDLLAGAIEHPATDVTIVVTLRADFYDRPLRHERFGRLLAQRTQPVPALDPEELERVVSSPARRAGVSLEPGLVARIISEMREQPTGLPLLQYALTELWKRRDGSTLSSRAYDASGGIGGAIARRAEEIVRELDADGRELARQLFLRLVELGEGTPDTSRRVRTSELQALRANRERMADVIERFARHRLLVFDRDPQSREPTLGLAHEALLAAWPRIQQWVDDARDDVRQQRRMAAAAGQWIENGRDLSYLLSGSRLDQASQWMASTRMLPGHAEREYLAAGEAERERVEADERERHAHEEALERRAVTRLRALVVTLGIGALVAGGLSVFALGESQRATRETRTATARGLAAAAVANLETDPERSILLALQAIDETETDGTVLPEAEEALHRAVVASRAVLTVYDEGGDVDWIESPALGSVIVTQGKEDTGVVSVRDATTGDVHRAWSAHEKDLNSVAFSADGSMLATSGDDGFLRVWNLATGDELMGHEGPSGGQVWGPSFSPDGTLVAAIWTSEGRMRVLDIETGESVLEGDGPTAPLSGTEFSPSGERLSVLGWDDAAGIIDLETGREVMHLDASVRAVAWSPDGDWIATASADTTAKIWDARTGEVRFTMSGHIDGLHAVDWSPDSDRIATGSGDGTAKVWQLDESGPREVLTLSSQDLRGGVGGVAFSPDGTKLVAGQFIDDAIKVWDIGLAGDAELTNMPAQVLGDGGLAFAGDGDSVVASSGDGRVTVWDPTGQGDGLVTHHHEDLVLSIGVSPDGTSVASGGADGRVAVWDRFTGALRFTHEAVGSDAGWVEAVAWGSDGVLAIARNAAPLVVVDGQGNEVSSLDVEKGLVVLALAFSQDGDRLAVSLVTADSERWDATRHRIEVWDWRQDAVVDSLVTTSWSLAFDPTDTRIATAHPSLPFAQIWDLASDTLEDLEGESGAVRDVAWSADGAQIATAGLDGVIRLWDAASGAHRLALHGHRTLVDKVRFSPDNSTLASIAPDGTLRMWALDLDDLIDIAWGKLSREFTHEDCQTLLRADCPSP